MMTTSTTTAAMILLVVMAVLIRYALSSILSRLPPSEFPSVARGVARRRASLSFSAAACMTPVSIAAPGAQTQMTPTDHHLRLRLPPFGWLRLLRGESLGADANLTPAGAGPQGVSCA